MPPRSRLTLLVVAGLTFGVVAAIVKGPDTDGITLLSRLRFDLTNLSAPWLLIAFVAGAQTRGTARGAGFGAAATLAALVGYYLVNALALYVDRLGFADGLAHAFWANRIYFAAGCLSGPLFGGLGALWRKSTAISALVVVGTLL